MKTLGWNLTKTSDKTNSTKCALIAIQSAHTGCSQCPCHDEKGLRARHCKESSMRKSRSTYDSWATQLFYEYSHTQTISKSSSIARRSICYVFQVIKGLFSILSKKKNIISKKISEGHFLRPIFHKIKKLVWYKFKIVFKERERGVRIKRTERERRERIQSERDERHRESWGLRKRIGREERKIRAYRKRDERLGGERKKKNGSNRKKKREMNF